VEEKLLIAVFEKCSRQPKPWIENVTDDFEGNYVYSASSFVFYVPEQSFFPLINPAAL
jgi:hypothetical protein